MTDLWGVVDTRMERPRRIVFGDQARAERFAAEVEGWEAMSTADERWLPLPGPLGSRAADSAS